MYNLAMSPFFFKINGAQPVALYLARTIGGKLAAGKQVLWLVPGGSAIQVATLASQRLEPKIGRLTITLTDERWSPVGHPDSNWQQLADAGFDFRNKQLLPVLGGHDLSETAVEFDSRLRQAFESAEYKIGLFGMGADGHTAGILPGSSAVNSQSLVVGYSAGQFDRITITPSAIKQLDEAVVYAVGAEKRAALKQLNQPLPLAKQPAQVFKHVGKVLIFNDQEGADYESR